ncbi:hypothetical protein OFB63_36820, partial [Escherichia coli]|nr:hypothetical protein [Escherichia coli]
MSPEQYQLYLQRQESTLAQSDKSDVWACGTILVELMTNQQRDLKDALRDNDQYVASVLWEKELGPR